MWLVVTVVLGIVGETLLAVSLVREVRARNRQRSMDRALLAWLGLHIDELESLMARARIPPGHADPTVPYLLARRRTE